jgi:phosphoribosylanthranilate isomerase
MRRTRVKICGVRDPDTALAAARAGADAVGVVLAPGSPRTADADAAAAIARVLPPLTTLVCVVRDQDPGEIRAMLPNERTLVQVHGDEDEQWIAAFGRPVIRAFPFDPEAIRRWERRPEVLALLIDGARPGTGQGFDHAALARLMPTVAKPVILAGGLTSETVRAAVRRIRPYGVDVSSSVESAPGVKDVERIAAFCAAVRRADD